MTASGFLWFFMIFQLILDMYLAAMVVYWIVQKRKYGSFHPLSAFQHREIRAASELVKELRLISEKASVLLKKTSEPIAVKTENRTASPLFQTSMSSQIPVSSLSHALPISPRPSTPMSQRTDAIRKLLKEGRSADEVRLSLGVSVEEVSLIKNFI